MQSAELHCCTVHQ